MKEKLFPSEWKDKLETRTNLISFYKRVAESDSVLAERM